jgi:hypothetical protein
MPETNKTDIDRILNSKNAYDILGISRNVDKKIAHAAWILLQQKYNNPAKPEENLELLKMINSAYEEIANMKKSPDSNHFYKEKPQNSYTEECKKIILKLKNCAMNDVSWFNAQFIECKSEITRIVPDFSLETCRELRDHILNNAMQKLSLVENDVRQNLMIKAMGDFDQIHSLLSSYDVIGFNTLTYTFMKHPNTTRILMSLKQFAEAKAKGYGNMINW